MRLELTRLACSQACVSQGPLLFIYYFFPSSKHVTSRFTCPQSFVRQNPFLSASRLCSIKLQQILFFFFPSSPFSARQDCQQRWRWTGPAVTGTWFQISGRLLPSCWENLPPTNVPQVPRQEFRYQSSFPVFPGVDPWHLTYLLSLLVNGFQTIF